MAELNLAAAKALCNADEFGLVQASHSRTIADDPGLLIATFGRARRMRDKWRDQANQQRRRVQRGLLADADEKNVRTIQKAQLFEETVARLEIQLEKLGGVAETKAAMRKLTRTRITKAERTNTHREARAVTKSKMKQKKLAIKANETRAEKFAAAKPPATTENPASAAEAAAKKPAPKRGIPKPKKPARPKVAGLAPFNPAQQLRAKTGANQARKRAAGLTSRIPGHVGARTRRKQAKRDSR